MRSGKKPLVMKRRIRREKKRKERTSLIAAVITLAIIILISGFLINSILNKPSTNRTVGSASEPKAAIVDQLSLTYTNQTFIQTITNTLKQAGYTVDYYPSEQVTIEFYRGLPSHGYKILVLRVHSGLYYGNKPPLGLFSSEPYTTSKYVYEQLTNQLLRASYANDNQTYFTIIPSFVKSSMNGGFQNTTIIMMGCNGLTYSDMAEAFLEKGARVYVSWDKAVSGSHTDTATARLLQHFLIEKRTLKESVRETFKEVGFDPAHKSLLLYYPLGAGNCTI